MDDLYSILPATQVPVAESPKKGDAAPEFPAQLKDKPSIIVFLRHCGCPFSEKAFLELHHIADSYGSKISYYAVSHASQTDTDAWVDEVGGKGPIQVIVDEERAVYGKWGLGLTGVAHTFGWTSLSQVVSLAWNEGIKNRATKGTRWQSSGFFGVSKEGKIMYAKAADVASEVPDFGDLAKQLLE